MACGAGTLPGFGCRPRKVVDAGWDRVNRLAYRRGVRAKEVGTMREILVGTDTSASADLAVQVFIVDTRKAQ